MPQKVKIMRINGKKVKRIRLTEEASFVAKSLLALIIALAVMFGGLYLLHRQNVAGSNAYYNMKYDVNSLTADGIFVEELFNRYDISTLTATLCEKAEEQFFLQDTSGYSVEKIGNEMHIAISYTEENADFYDEGKLLIKKYNEAMKNAVVSINNEDVNKVGLYYDFFVTSTNGKQFVTHNMYVILKMK